MLEGMDAGVSFHSRHDAGAGLTWTVVSNTTDGAWPIVRHLAELLRWQGLGKVREAVCRWHISWSVAV